MTLNGSTVRDIGNPVKGLSLLISCGALDWLSVSLPPHRAKHARRGIELSCL